MHTKTLAAGTAALVALLVVLPAFADEGPGPDKLRIREHVATTVPARIIGEKAGLIRGFQSLFRRGDEKRNERAGASPIEIGGTVSAVTGSSFSIQLPARREQATTSVMITTNASTTFRKDRGETAALSDVATGVFVKVKGTLVSTSTREIAALRVDIASSSPRMMVKKLDDVKLMVKSTFEIEDATTTPKELQDRVRSILQSILGQFGFFLR